MHALVLLAAAALPACPPGGYGGQFAFNGGGGYPTSPYGYSPYGYGGGSFPASTQLQFEFDRGNGHRHFRPFFRPQPRERLFLNFSNQQQQLGGFPGYGGGYPVSPYGYGGGFSPSPYGYGGGFSPYGYGGGFGRGG
jgi:hypothetical protein